MVKVKQKDFDLFKKEFMRWYEKFGLGEYSVYFEFKKLDEAYAEIWKRSDSNVITVALNNELSPGAYRDRDVKDTAKHEALHLLLWDLSRHSYNRFGSPREIDLSEEKLVQKLIGLIK